MSSTELAVRYKAIDGEDVSLDRDFVQKYVLTGNGHATDAEMMSFLTVCKVRGINPLVKGEAYLIKYGDSQPASIVVGIDFTMRVMDMQESYDGFEAGIVVRHPDGSTEKQVGCLLDPNDKLLGGWCDIFRTDRTRPTRHSVTFSEYNTGKSAWAKYPTVMIQKVAIQQCARKAFPAALSGLYAAEEIRDEREPVRRAVSVEGTVEAVEPPKPVSDRREMTANEKAWLADFSAKVAEDIGKDVVEVKKAIWLQLGGAPKKDETGGDFMRRAIEVGDAMRQAVTPAQAAGMEAVEVEEAEYEA